MSPRQKTELKKQVLRELTSLPEEEWTQFKARAEEESKSPDAEIREYAIVALEAVTQILED